MTTILISWPRGSVGANLCDTVTARALLAALPLTSTASTWGDEVYFHVPFDAPAEPDASEVVAKGAVCYWLDGSAIALLFGPTPASRGDECRLISKANIVGQIDGDAVVLRSVEPGDPVRIDRA